MMWMGIMLFCLLSAIVVGCTLHLNSSNTHAFSFFGLIIAALIMMVPATKEMRVNEIARHKQQFEQITREWKVVETITPNAVPEDDPMFDPTKQVYRVRKIDGAYVVEGILCRPKDGNKNISFGVIKQHVLGPVEEVLNEGESLQVEKEQ